MLFTNPRINTRNFDLLVGSFSIKGSALKLNSKINVKFRIMGSKIKSDFIEITIEKENVSVNDLIKIITNEYPEYFL